MESNKNYFFVGLFVLGCIIGGMGFAVWLAAHGKGDFNRYRIRFSESVSGLSIGGAVKFRGVDVGNVESIVIDPKDTRLIQVNIHVLNTTPVKADTVATLKLQGVTGVVFIELSGGSPASPRLVGKNEDDIPEIPMRQSSIDAIVDRLPRLLENATNIVEQVNKLLANRNIDAAGDVLRHAEAIGARLEAEADQVSSLLKQGTGLMAQWNQVTRESRGAIEDTIAHLRQTAHDADRLVLNLHKTSRSVGRLSESLEEDPSRLIFPRPEAGVPAP